MTRKPKPFAHRATLLVASLLSTAAMLALAGPAVSNGGGADHPGFHDDDPAGQIASFDKETGMLVIDLAEGGSIAGLVTRRTWIEADEGCGDERRTLHGWCRLHLGGSNHGDGDGHHHGWRHRSRGDSDDLIPGAIVEDALLVLKDGRAFFWKVELEDD
jgi:hypothetical protein